MALPVNLRKFKILIAPDSKKEQGLKQGDVVRRQFFDGTNVVRSTMVVLSSGVETRSVSEVIYDAVPVTDDEGNPVLNSDGTQATRTVARVEQVLNPDNSPKLDSAGNPIYNVVTQQVDRTAPYFIGLLLEGDAPKSGELLDFARITNLFDTDRLGALYLTASDDESPFMDVIDGIGRNKSLCWPEGLPSEGFEDASSQYITKGAGLECSYISSAYDNRRIYHARRTEATLAFSGLKQDFYELVRPQKRILVSYKARSSAPFTVGATITYANGVTSDATWTENFDTEWQYYFRAVNVINSGRHLRSFKLDFQSLGVGEWVEVADFNIILQDSILNFGDATSMRVGKLDGVVDPVYGTLSGYGAYIQKLYVAQTAHISGTLTAGDENGFASTFYAGKIHKNCFHNSCDINFLNDAPLDNGAVVNPTGMGNVYRFDGNRTISMIAQDRDWIDAHQGQRYCYSFWGYFKNPCDLNVLQNGVAVGVLHVLPEETHEWRRLHLFFDILDPGESAESLILQITSSFNAPIYTDVSGSIDPNANTMFFTAPQLESGENCTQYQPTDDELAYTEDYGAWMARGGIGGTIQNPLLQLNMLDVDENGNKHEGTIGTRTKSFALRTDGSGYLANRNIKWDPNGKVTFGSGVTLNWDNLDGEAQEKMTNRYVRISGNDTFTVVGQEDTATGKVFSPATISLNLEEVGFSSTSSQRQWYVKRGDEYEAISGANGMSFVVYPEADIWNSESTLTLRCVITLDPAFVYFDTITIKKLFVQGYTVSVVSSKGTGFRNGSCATILTAYVYYQGQLVDPEYARSNFVFNWKRYASGDLTTAIPFTDYDEDDSTPDTIHLNYELDGSDIFVCELSLPDQFDYTFPIIF